MYIEQNAGTDKIYRPNQFHPVAKIFNFDNDTLNRTLGNILPANLDARIIFDNHRPHLIHLSHTDLDGIGALSLTYYMQWYLNRKHGRFPDALIPRIEHPLIEWCFTDMLGKDFQRKLNRMAEHVNHIMCTEMSLISCDLTNAVTRIPITLLITDIGGVTPEMLKDHFFAFLKPPQDPRLVFDLDVIVIDHHQNAILEGNDSVLLQVYYDNNNHDVPANYTADATFVIRTGENHCGSSILWSLLNRDPDDHELDMVSKTVEEITRYDTGRGGNWSIPADKHGDPEYYRDEVSEAIKLNQWWHIHHLSAEAGNKLSYHIFMRELALRYVLSLDEIGDDAALSLCHGERDDEIEESIVQMNKDFDGFLKSIHKVETFINNSLSININGVDKSLEIPGWLMRAAADYQHRENFSIGVYVRRDKNEPYPAFTSYSRRIFTEMPTRWAWLMVIDASADDGTVEFSLRSADPTVDMARWAKTFGGGGHPCAAGFKLTFNETDRS